MNRNFIKRECDMKYYLKNYSYRARTMESKRPRKPVAAEKAKIFGAVAPKAITINNPLSGLLANAT